MNAADGDESHINKRYILEHLDSQAWIVCLIGMRTTVVRQPKMFVAVHWPLTTGWTPKAVQPRPSPPNVGSVKFCPRRPPNIPIMISPRSDSGCETRQISSCRSIAQKVKRGTYVDDLIAALEISAVILPRDKG